jgi:hypothetical protein
MHAAPGNSLSDRILSLDVESLSPAAAKAVLTIKIRKPTITRFNELSALAKKGALTEQQREELEDILRFGDFISLLHAKARIALKRASESKPRRKSA